MQPILLLPIKVPYPTVFTRKLAKLRKVMVCSPGLAHKRLTPTNCDDLLFDDVMWVEMAKRDHLDFIAKMRDRGIDVIEMHEILAETLEIPAAKKC